MKKLAIYFIFSSCLMALTSCMSSKTDSKRVAMEQNKSKFGKKQTCDTRFAVCAAEGNMMELKLAELAQTNSTSSSVKQFAGTMAENHSAANNKLKAIAAEKNISLPGKLSDKSQKSYESLAKKTGKDFDKSYMRSMVKDHKHDICAYKKEAKKGKDVEIKKWASDEVPVLKKHLDMAKSTCKDMKK